MRVAPRQSIVVSHTLQGSGRSYVLIVEDGTTYQAIAQELAPLLIELGQICLVTLRPLDDDWRAATAELLALFESLGIRNTAFISFGDASVIAQALCLKNPRLLRTLVLIDAATRAHPTAFVQRIERIEKFLPLGLPFRSDFPGFDGKPFLQRIRCPVLVALSAQADDYRQAQAAIISEGMPTTFFVQFAEDNFVSSLAQTIKEFQKVPAKSPQKNLKAA